MMTTIESVQQLKPVLMAAAFALVLAVMGCAATGAGPITSHGVDYAPSFNPEEGVG
jgi:hypothetical protein